ncbi:hypothetical protein [Escherichia Stx1 converting phage]|uniref:Uncharacterized protein n=1 Tax=Escherichia phage Stx2 II TaxID=194949 RepID=Q7Y2H5_9CAUD|nr:hypothetical protein Stx1_p158 [Escherichia Stx1 converting phage]NP_859408.1 hypothetical protein Stx2II_p161 [Escherichia phage Stx2 II]BAC77974.1 hypothetical protein [Escherichia Stx1 converting phage]BAC78145.1 hypothetical protein [Escherichia phage Stx2 II]
MTLSRISGFTLLGLMVCSQPASFRSGMDTILRCFPSSATITISVIVDAKRCLNLANCDCQASPIPATTGFMGTYGSPLWLTT